MALRLSAFVAKCQWWDRHVRTYMIYQYRSTHRMQIQIHNTNTNTWYAIQIQTVSGGARHVRTYIILYITLYITLYNRLYITLYITHYIVHYIIRQIIHHTKCQWWDRPCQDTHYPIHYIVHYITHYIIHQITYYTYSKVSVVRQGMSRHKLYTSTSVHTAHKAEYKYTIQFGNF